jgi:hypothetical protein
LNSSACFQRHSADNDKAFKGRNQLQWCKAAKKDSNLSDGDEAEINGQFVAIKSVVNRVLADTEVCYESQEGNKDSTEDIKTTDEAKEKVEK